MPYVLNIAVAALAVTSMITVLQRIAQVRRQARLRMGPQMPGRPEVAADPRPPPTRRDLLRNWLVRKLYRFGWRVAPWLPVWLVSVIISAGSWMALRRAGVHVHTLRQNLSHATGEPVSDELLRAGLSPYLRTFYEVLALPAWSAAEIRQRVSAVNEATGTGGVRGTWRCRRPAAQRELGSGRRLGLCDRHARHDGRRAAAG